MVTLTKEEQEMYDQAVKSENHEYIFAIAYSIGRIHLLKELNEQ